ncbi:MAG: sensory protein TspO [Rhizobiales bacterium]|nr:sensory protein TspO [Hyphomicrobiales bacterium]
MDASLIVFLALVALVALSGVFFAPGAWYDSLSKPSWTPPGWLFGPAWTILYIMIAIAGWLVWAVAPVSSAMAFWVAQLIFNAAWSWLFFGLKRMDLALGDIAFMVAAIVGFIGTAWPVSETAALLFVPYLLWVLFAGSLNASIWMRNAPRRR